MHDSVVALAHRKHSDEGQDQGPETVEVKSGAALIGFRGVGLNYLTSAGMRVPSRALPRRRALCTNWKKPRWSGSLSCEMPRCGRSQERNSDQNPFIVLTWISQKLKLARSSGHAARFRERCFHADDPSPVCP